MIFRCIPISKKQDGCSSKEQPSQSVKEPLISRAARRPRQPVLGAVCKKKKAPSSQMVLFWSGRRGSNSLPGIPRMAMAIRGSPASPRMISRAARRPRQPVLGAVCKKKKAPSSQMVLFWSGRRGSNSLPGIPRMAMAIRGSPASPRMISRAARRPRQPVLGAVCKKKKAPSSQMVLFWSGRRGSNSLPRPWQGRALPDELRPQTQDRL